MRYAYDTHYFPPAPSIEFRLSVPEQAFTGRPLRAFVDTGADATIVPFRHIRSLGLQVDNRKYLRSQFGERVKVDVYLLDVGIGDVRLPLIEIIADESGSEIIVGRNILNKLMVVLDGPRQMLEIRTYVRYAPQGIMGYRPMGGRTHVSYYNRRAAGAQDAGSRLPQRAGTGVPLLAPRRRRSAQCGPRDP